MALELLDIRKSFGAVHANDGVSLRVEAGTIHGLLGENGAGKSTLMKVLSGFLACDSGEVIVDGERVRLGSPKEAIRSGIGMLHQDPLVFLPFTVLDNFLLDVAGSGRLDRANGARELARIGDQFGFGFDPGAPARSLTVGERQQLEIARLLHLGARVLILDEPTTGISATQQEKLFSTLRTLAGSGMIVIFVSHKLEEIESICGRVTVMRKGKVVGETALPCPTDRLVEMMFGHAVTPTASASAPGSGTALEVERVTVEERLIKLEAVSLSVRQGEVVGLAGLEGSGQRTFLRACCGLLRSEKGRMVLGGRDLTGQSYREFMSAGIHYLPAGRLEEGLIAGLTLTEHFLLSGGPREFFVDWDAARRRAVGRIEENFIVGTPESPAESLSGGNQQRLLLAMMPPTVRLLLMEHPTRGLDLESADWVWTQLLKRRESGTAIVFSSADLDELLRYSDRILVFFAGRILKVLDTAVTDRDQLGHLIGGKEAV
jgi:ABC-type uncharacterized transport system ATPase subunit